MAGDNIICFAKDWCEDPTSNNHVMRLLAQDHRVLWLNSISMRTPSFTSGRDVRKIWNKLVSFTRGASRVSENLWVYTPIVLPFPHSRAAVAINRCLLRLMLKKLRRQLGMDTFQLWTFLPNAVEYAGTLGESLLVYYCTDEWSQFSFINGEQMAAMERELCERADLVFTTAHSLRERKRPHNQNTQLALHGVDHAAFRRALEDATPVPADLAALPQPVIGFFGLIHEWIDLDLVAYLAKRHPEWSLALIGKSCVDVTRLARFPNIHFLGRRPYEQLPGYCKGMAAALIPFTVNELTLHINPIKLREYLSAGVPVVSTALPEVAYYRHLCAVAESYQEFEQGIVEALRSDTPDRRRRRSEAMRSETWERKVAELIAHVERVKARRDAPAGAPWGAPLPEQEREPRKKTVGSGSRA